MIYDNLSQRVISAKSAFHYLKVLQSNLTIVIFVIFSVSGSKFLAAAINQLNGIINMNVV